MTPSLLSENRNHFSYYKFKIFDEKWLRQPSEKYKDYPLRTFSGGVWTNGYSDHFPVYMVLIRELSKNQER
jgi:hypothetical protein